jgi:hypothetical protein
MEKNIHQIWIGPFEMPDREKKSRTYEKRHNKLLNTNFKIT